MKAIVRTKAGKEFSTMEVQEIPSPSPQRGEIKVKMKSSRINPVDMDLMAGFPTLKYKNPQIGGVDGAGEIIELGEGASNFQLGDKIFFYRKFTDIGTWAEEVVISANDVALIPTSITPEEAGSMALPILTAYEALMALAPGSGQSILIHGAGGGVGFQAVQVAKSLGLKVIANGSEVDRAKLNNAGVDLFIDYKKEDFAEILKDDKPDYVFDVIGKDTLMKSIQLKPSKVISTSFPDTAQMGKTGVQLPAILKFVMKQMNRRFVKAAQKNGVELMGQVTRANGKKLEEAAKFAGENQFVAPSSKAIAFSQVKEQGLSKEDVGKVINFDA